MLSTPTTITLGTDVFINTDVASATLTVPSGSETAYGAAAQWSTFGNYATSCTGLSIENLSLEDSFSISPNPAQNKMHIEQNSFHNLEQISIYDTQGKQVLNSTKPTIDVSSLVQGIYIVKITSSAGNITKKLIKN